MNLLIPIIFAILSGLAMSIQPGINSILARAVQSPWIASTISFLVGTVALAVISFGFGEFKSVSLFSEAVKSQPWWIWTGGLLGALIVTSALVFAPKIGATSWIALYLVGQVATSVFLEKWGVLGFPEKRMSLEKLLGLALLILSVWLVKRGD